MYDASLDIRLRMDGGDGVAEAGKPVETSMPSMSIVVMPFAYSGDDPVLHVRDILLMLLHNLRLKCTVA